MSENHISSFDGTRLFLNREVDPACKAVVVIVHGLCEHQGRYEYFANKLHEAGYGTYRFDHRGHGRSEGETTHLSDFNELLDDTNVVVDLAIKENPGKSVFLYGHSMGGFTVALYGAKYTSKKLSGIICNGGLTADNAGIIRSAPAGIDVHTKLPNELGDGVCSVPEVREWYLQDPFNSTTYTFGLVYALQAGIAWFAEHRSEFRFPVLITHGEKDGLVSQQDSRDMFDLISSTDKSLKIYGSVLHETINEYIRDEVIDDYIRWMDRRA